MGITLTGKPIKDTYQGILKLSDNNPINTAFRGTTDGFGNETGIEVSSTSLRGKKLYTAMTIAEIDADLSDYVVGSREWVLSKIASSGVSTFLGLTDTPSSFYPKRRQNVKANAAGDAVEFTPDYMDFACSDEESDLVVKKYVFEMVCNRDYKDVSGFHFSVTTAPTGSPLIVDVWKNGTSVYTTQPEIEISEFSTHTSATAGTLAGTNANFSIGDRLQVSVEQIGSTVAGKGLKCTMTYNEFIPV